MCDFEKQKKLLIEYVENTNDKEIDVKQFIRFNTPMMMADFNKPIDFLNISMNPKVILKHILAFNEIKNEMIYNREHNKNKKKAYEYYCELFEKESHLRKYSEEEFDKIFKVFNEIDLAENQKDYSIHKDVITLYNALKENFLLEQIYGMLIDLSDNPKMFISSLSKRFDSLNAVVSKKISNYFLKCFNAGIKPVELSIQILILIVFDFLKDYNLEDKYIYYDFSSKLSLSLSQKVIIVNPNPLFIYKWRKDSYLYDTDLTLVFSEESQTKLFNSIFGRSNIKSITINDFSNNFDWNAYNHCELNVMIFGNRTNSKSDKRFIFKTIVSNAKPESLMISVLDSDKEVKDSINNYVVDGSLKLVEATIVPENIINNSEKKRKLLANFTNKDVEGFYLKRYKTNNSKSSEVLIPFAETIYCGNFDFSEDLRSYSYNFSRDVEKKSDRKRNKSMTFNFSTEISFTYSCSYNEKNAEYRVEAYANKPANNLLFESENDRSERILSTKKSKKLKNESDIITWLNDVYPFGDIKTKDGNVIEVKEEISNEYFKVYKDMSLSLKSFYYLYRDEFEKYGQEQNDLIAKLFNMELGEFCGDEIKIEYLDNFLNTTNFEYNDTVIKKLISDIIDLQIKLGHAKRNNIKKWIKKDSNYSDENIRNIRNNLTIKNLTEKENKSLFKLLYKKCNSDSGYLGCLIKLLTGLESGIVCALKWCDLQKFEDYNIENNLYHLVIRRQLINDGSNYCSLKRREMYRKIPLNDMLVDILLSIKESRMRIMKIDEEQFGMLPIVIGTDNVIDGICRVMAPYKLSNLSKELIKTIRPDYDMKSEIIKKDKTTIETNFLQYSGDLLKSNYFHYGLHVAKLEKGEINYLSGKQNDTTFASHYCDYDNDAAQLLLKKKQERMVALFSDELNDCTSKIDEITNDNEIYKTSDNPKGVTKLMMVLNTKPGETEVCIENENGLDILIQKAGGGNDGHV